MLREITSLSLPSTPGKWAAVPLSDEQPERAQPKRTISQSMPESPLSHLPGFSTLSLSNPSSPSKARPILRRHLVLFSSSEGKQDDDSAGISLIGHTSAREGDGEEDYNLQAADEAESFNDEADEAEASARLLMLLNDAGSTRASIEEVLRAAASCFSARLVQHARTEGIRDSASLVALPQAARAALTAYMARPDVAAQLERAPSEQRAQLLELIRAKPGGAQATGARPPPPAASEPAAAPPAALLRARAARAAKRWGSAASSSSEAPLIVLEDHPAASRGTAEMARRHGDGEGGEEEGDDDDEEEETFDDLDERESLGSLGQRQHRADASAAFDEDEDDEMMRPPSWAQRDAQGTRSRSKMPLKASLPSPIGQLGSQALSPHELGWHIDDEWDGVDESGSMGGPGASGRGRDGESSIRELEAALAAVDGGHGPRDSMKKSAAAYTHPQDAGSARRPESAIVDSDNAKPDGSERAPWDFGAAGAQRASPGKVGGSAARQHSPGRMRPRSLEWGLEGGGEASPPISPDRSLEAQPSFLDANGLPAHLQLPESSDEDEEGEHHLMEQSPRLGGLGARLAAVSMNPGSQGRGELNALSAGAGMADDDNLPPWLQRR